MSSGLKFFQYVVFAAVLCFSGSVMAEQATAEASVPAAASVEKTPAAATPCDTGTPAVAAPTPAKEEDPCAAYAGSYEAHIVCLDQLSKIKRMMEAQQPPPPAVAPAAPPVPAK